MSDLERYHVKTYVISVPHSQISLQFNLRPTVVFGLQAISYKNQVRAPNDPQITLNALRSNVPYICTTSTTKPQLSVRLALWQVVFELHAILKRVHRMTPK